MTTTVNRKDLLQALKLADKVSDRKGFYAAAWCKITAKDGVMTIESTDEDQYAKTTLAYSGDDLGPVCVDIRLALFGMETHQQDYTELEIEVPSFDLSISGYLVDAHKPTNFDLLITFATRDTDQGSATMPAKDWLNNLSQVAPCMSKDAARYYLNGVLIRSGNPGKDSFDKEGNRLPGPFLSFVAADGHRLAALDVANEANTVTGDRIIPYMAVKNLIYMLRRAPKDTPVSFAFGANLMRAVIGDVEYVTKLVDGNYPDYGRVIPGGRNHAKTARIDLDGLVKAAKNIADRKDIECPDRAILMEVQDGWCVYDTSGHAYAYFSGTIIGAPLTIGFNTKYLQDLAKTFPKGSMLKLEMGTPSDPVLVTSDSNPGLRYVVMPVRV